MNAHKIFVVALVVLVVGLLPSTVAAQEDSAALTRALAAQGLAWRLLNESDELNLKAVISLKEATSHWNEGNLLLKEGNYFEAQRHFEMTSGEILTKVVTYAGGEEPLEVYNWKVVQERWSLIHVIAYIGGTEISPSIYVWACGGVPFEDVHFAFDGDPSTCWQGKTTGAGALYVFSETLLRGVTLEWETPPGEYGVWGKKEVEWLRERGIRILFREPTSYISLQFDPNEVFALKELELLLDP